MPHIQPASGKAPYPGPSHGQGPVPAQGMMQREVGDSYGQVHLPPPGHGPGPFPYDMLPPLPPPEVLEQKLGTQRGEIQKLAVENDRLAASHASLWKELAAAQQQELQRLQAQGDAAKAAEKQEAMGHLERVAKMEADLKACDTVKAKLQQAQSLAGVRQKMEAYVQKLSKDLQRNLDEAQQLQALMAERDAARQEYQHLRYKFDDECITKAGNRMAREEQHWFEEEDLRPLHPRRSEGNIILFFTRNNLKEEKLCVLMSLIKASGKPEGIMAKPSEMAEFTPCQEIELHGASVKFAFASISYKYCEAQTLGVLLLRLQLRKTFCRSSSSLKCFASLGNCSTSWIRFLWSLYLRNLCPFIFRFLPEFTTLSPGLLSKFQEEHVHLPLIEIAAGQSTELPREILMDIFSLLEIPDLVRAGSVCSSWNYAYTSLCNIGQYKQSQTPCLLYTSESADENVACLYSLAEKRTYSLTLPQPPIHRRYLIGSSHGWLVTVDERSEMHLVNPITCEQIALPSVITIEHVKPIYDDTSTICKYHYSAHTAGSVARQRSLILDIDKLRCYLHHKAFVFYETSSRMYIVVFIHNPSGQIVFARLGDDKWTQLTSQTHFQDCIYKDGLLYAVTALGEIITFNLSGSVVTTEIVMGRVKDYCGGMRFYIVQAPWGDLLQVWRPEVRIKEDEHRHRRNFKNNIKWMEIYKVCTVTKKLVQIDNLDGHVLFLGRNQSICSRAEEYPQLKPNHVYFTDDADGLSFTYEWGCRLNIGILNYDNNSIGDIMLSRPWSNCLSPLLIIPNPRKMDSTFHI